MCCISLSHQRNGIKRSAYGKQYRTRSSIRPLREKLGDLGDLHLSEGPEKSDDEIWLANCDESCSVLGLACTPSLSSQSMFS